MFIMRPLSGPKLTLLVVASIYSGSSAVRWIMKPDEVQVSHRPVLVVRVWLVFGDVVFVVVLVVIDGDLLCFGTRVRQ